MVSFQCEGCGDTVKKPKLDAHYARCYSPVVCIDCSTTFHSPADWKAHTTCITEAEKYQKALYKGPKKNGWNDSVSGTYGQPGRGQGRGQGRGGFQASYGPTRQQSSGANNTPLGGPNRMTPTTTPTTPLSPTPDANASGPAATTNSTNGARASGLGHGAPSRGNGIPRHSNGKSGMSGEEGTTSESKSNGQMDSMLPQNGKPKKKRRTVAESVPVVAENRTPEPTVSDASPVVNGSSLAKKSKKRKDPSTESVSEEQQDGPKKNKKRKTDVVEDATPAAAPKEKKKSKKKDQTDVSLATNTPLDPTPSAPPGDAPTTEVADTDGATKDKKKKKRKSAVALEDAVEPIEPANTSVDVPETSIDGDTKKVKSKKSKKADLATENGLEQESLPLGGVKVKKRKLEGAVDDPESKKKKKKSKAVVADEAGNT